MPQGKGTYGSTVGRPPETFTKKSSGFKMKGWSAFTKHEGDHKEEITPQTVKPKKEITPATKDPDTKRKEVLISKLRNLKDPRDSEEGVRITNILMDDFGMSPEGVEDAAL